MSTILLDSSNLSSINSNLDDDPDDSIIKLRLKKPPGWNWELSTSKSSPNIAFPRILLYDDKGDLLADAKEADCIFTGSKNNDNNNNEYYFQRSQSTKTPRSSSVSTDGKRAASISSSSIKSKYKERRSSSTNLKEINECLDDIVDRLKNHGIDYKLRHNPNSQSRVGSNERKLKRYDSYNTISKGNDVNGLESCEGNINERIRTRRNSIHTIVEDAVSNNNNNNTTTTTTNPDSTTKTSINVNSNNNNKLEKLEDNESRKSDEVSEIPIFVYSEKGLIRRDLNSKEFDHIRKRYKKSLTSNLEDVQLKDSLTRSKLLEDDVKKVQVKTSATNYNNNKNNNNNNIDSPKLVNKSLTPVKEVRFDLQKSKSAADVTGGREKKKCRRSSTSDPTRPSGSILERMSMFKRRSSSTDSQDIEITNVNHGPRYYLRTSNAGTLVVCEESIRDIKIRRRSKTCSRISENDEGFDPNNNTTGLGTSREKLIQKYLYLGTSTEIGDSNKNESNFLNSNKNKDPNHYDKAIAKIDKLISRESLRRTDKSQLFLRNSPRNSLNLSENNSSNNSTNNNSYNLKKSASGTVFNNHRNNSNKILSKDNNNLSYSSNDRNSFLSVPSDPVVNDHQHQKRDQSVSNSNDTKVKRRKKLKQLRRCVSVGAINNDMTSSDDEDTKTESSRTRGRSKLATSRETLQKPYGKSSSDLCTRYAEIMSSSRPPKSPHVKQAPIIKKI